MIVEDEFINLELLRGYLEEMGYEIAGDAMNPEEAIEVLERFDTDLVILDVNLKSQKDGIWIAEEIRAHYHIPFIFLTAYSDRQTVERAATVNPYAYLVKPFTKADVFTAIEIALKNYAKEHHKVSIPKDFLEEGTELAIGSTLFVKDNNSYKKILIADIKYIQAYKNYMEVVLKTGRVVLRSSLQKCLGILPHTHFAQTHRSFIVNMDCIDSIEHDFIHIGDKKIPLSRSYRDELFGKMKFLG